MDKYKNIVDSEIILFNVNFQDEEASLFDRRNHVFSLVSKVLESSDFENALSEKISDDKLSSSLEPLEEVMGAVDLLYSESGWQSTLDFEKLEKQQTNIDSMVNAFMLTVKNYLSNPSNYTDEDLKSQFHFKARNEEELEMLDGLLDTTKVLLKKSINNAVFRGSFLAENHKIGAVLSAEEIKELINVNDSIDPNDDEELDVSSLEDNEKKTSTSPTKTVKKARSCVKSR